MHRDLLTPDPAPQAPMPLLSSPALGAGMAVSMAYGASGNWRTLALVGAAHLGLVFVLLSMEPVARAIGLTQPLMVSLLTPPSPPAPVVESRPKPLPPSPRVEPPPLPLPPPPVLSTPEAAPSPMVVAPPPSDPVPVPAILPPPAPAPVKPAPAAVAYAPPAPAVEAVVSPRFDADYLHNPAPAYPALSRRMGEQGRVLLRVYVHADGSPGQVEIRESCGFERLDRAARDTVARWRFAPARQGERAVAAWVLVPVSFNLRS
ncbi:MAG: energy transducer TonB [Betaproteobacteria bacterium]|nr:energy transducer TonB [Betaproteobacteria bacterium]